jgi:hypothetical protein
MLEEVVLVGIVKLLFGVVWRFWNAQQQEVESFFPPLLLPLDTRRMAVVRV